ncbi:MAG: hypothetical protein V1701_05840 [Planctomycetota bacterium]
MKVFIKLSVVLTVWVIIDIAVLFCYEGFDKGTALALEKANQLARDHQFSLSLESYRNIQSNPFFIFSPWKEYVGNGIKELQLYAEKEAQAKLKLDELLSRVKGATETQYDALIDQLKEFINTYGDTGLVETAVEECDNLSSRKVRLQMQQANEKFPAVRLEADNLVARGEYHQALEEYRVFARANPRLADPLRNTINNEMKTIKKRMDKETEAEHRLDDILARVEDSGKERFPALIQELEKFIEEYGQTAYAQEAAEELEYLKQELAEESPDEAFARVRGEANELINKGDLNGALGKYRAFISENPGLDEPLKDKVNSGMKAIKKLMQEQQQNGGAK